MAVRAVLVGGFALLAAFVAVALFHSEQRQAGSNHVPEVGEVVKRRGAWRHCQNGEIAPKDAVTLRLLVGTYGRPTPELRVTARSSRGEVVTVGRLVRGSREGHVEIPIRPVENTRSGLRVCVSVSGTGRTVLYGAGDVLRLEWLRDGRESWFALLPVVSHRFGLGKANALGGLLLIITGLALVVCWLATSRLVLREVGQ